MKLYAGKVNAIAAEIVRSLSTAGDIEVGSPSEVVKDVEGVLKSYLQAEADVNDKTKDLLARTGRSMDDYGKVRVSIAETNGIKVGDEMLEYLLGQLLETFGTSKNVDEIFAEDIVLRRKMIAVFKKYLSEDAELDAAIRAQLRHLKEGSPTWDVEYERLAEQTKRKRGLA